MADQSKSRKSKNNQKTTSSPKRYSATILVALITVAGTIIVAFVNIVPAIIRESKPPTPVEPTLVTCRYPGTYNDTEAIRWLIEQEARAVDLEDMDLIKDLFTENAVIGDYFDRNSPDKWNNPIDRYQPLFMNYEFDNPENIDIKAVGSKNNGATRYYISGSRGQYTVDGQTHPFQNPQDASHWTVEQVEGCWKIVKFDFNASGIVFP